MKKRIDFVDSLGYAAFMIIANLTGSIAVILLMSILGKSNEHNAIVKNYKVFSVILALVGVVVTTVVTAFYFKRKLINRKFYEGKTQIKDVFRCYSLLVFPGEIIRLVLSFIPMKPGSMFGYRLFDGFLAFPPNLVCDWIYMVPNNRLESIKKLGYTANDNIVFIIIYLIYFAISIGISFVVFTQIWKSLENMRKNEIKIHMDPDQIK